MGGARGEGVGGRGAGPMPLPLPPQLLSPRKNFDGDKVPC